MSTYTNQTFTRDFLKMVEYSTLINEKSGHDVLVITVINKGQVPSVVVTGSRRIASAIRQSNFTDIFDPESPDGLIHLPLMRYIPDKEVDSMPLSTLSAYSADVLALTHFPFVFPYMREKPDFWPPDFPYKAISSQPDRVNKFKEVLKSFTKSHGKTLLGLCGKTFCKRWRGERTEESSDDGEEEQMDEADQVHEERVEIEEDIGAAAIDHAYERGKKGTGWRSVRHVFTEAVKQREDEALKKSAVQRRARTDASKEYRAIGRGGARRGSEDVDDEAQETIDEKTNEGRQRNEAKDVQGVEVARQREDADRIYALHPTQTKKPLHLAFNEEYAASSASAAPARSRSPLAPSRSPVSLAKDCSVSSVVSAIADTVATLLFALGTLDSPKPSSVNHPLGNLPFSLAVSADETARELNEAPAARTSPASPPGGETAAEEEEVARQREKADGISALLPPPTEQQQIAFHDDFAFENPFDSPTRHADAAAPASASSTRSRSPSRSPVVKKLVNLEKMEEDEDVIQTQRCHASSADSVIIADTITKLIQALVTLPSSMPSSVAPPGVATGVETGRKRPNLKKYAVKDDVYVPRTYKRFLASKDE